MEKKEILNNIFSKTNSGIKLGLERMLKASGELGNPHLAYKVIHVAGTNGKGSVCTFMETALRSLGFRTGLYTSPHLVNFNERFKINGISCKDDEWLSVYKDIKKITENYDLTFFEISTLIAFILFKNAKVEYAIIETGLGGRLDATNIVDPEVSIITKIGIDHIAYLGDNIVSIAQEKLGIVKENKPVVMLNPDEKGIKVLAENIALEKNSDIYFVDFPKKKIELKMKGTYQQLNANTVIKALDLIGFCDTAMNCKNLSMATLAGRFDLRSIRDKYILFDVSHNPQAVNEFVNNIKDEFNGRGITLVVGLMKDKDTSLIIAKYCEIAEEIILTKPATDRSEDPEKLADMVTDNSIKISVTKNVKDAVNLALQKDSLICITGSFFTVGEAMEYLNIDL